MRNMSPSLLLTLILILHLLFSHDAASMLCARAHRALFILWVAVPNWMSQNLHWTICSCISQRFCTSTTKTNMQRRNAARSTSMCSPISRSVIRMPPKSFLSIGCVKRIYFVVHLQQIQCEYESYTRFSNKRGSKGLFWCDYTLRLWIRVLSKNTISPNVWNLG